MELPDRIEDMNRDQRMHLDMLIDQVDAEFPLDRMNEERLAKDPHLAILPSGRTISTREIRQCHAVTLGMPGKESEGLMIAYEDGEVITICGPGFNQVDAAAFRSALNDIGVYVAAPTLKGDDADGDGIIREGTPHESATGAPV